VKRRLLIVLGEIPIRVGGWMTHYGLLLTDLGDRISPRGAYLRWPDGVPTSASPRDVPMQYVKDGSPYRRRR
jgi:hypothetical protein